jgi:hypothetical protein
MSELAGWTQVEMKKISQQHRAGHGILPAVRVGR